MTAKTTLLFLVAAAGLAQAPEDFRKTVRGAMAPALAQQHASILKQTPGTHKQPAVPKTGFFTLPPLPRVAAFLECEPMPEAELEFLIESASEQEGVDAELIRAVIDQESGGRPCAISVSNAMGLMQLMPDTAQQFDVRDPFDPQQNVEAGTKLLRLLLTRYGDDVGLALAAYNAGSARVDGAGRFSAIPETVDYVSAILTKLGLRGRSEEKRGEPEVQH